MNILFRQNFPSLWTPCPAALQWGLEVELHFTKMVDFITHPFAPGGRVDLLNGYEAGWAPRTGVKKTVPLPNIKARPFWAVVRSVHSKHYIDQCFSIAGPRPGTGPWHQLYRAARSLRKLQYATRFH